MLQVNGTQAGEAWPTGATREGKVRVPGEGTMERVLRYGQRLSHGNNSPSKGIGQRSGSGSWYRWGIRSLGEGMEDEGGGGGGVVLCGKCTKVWG